MRLKSILGLMCAAAISLALAGHASAQQTVKIGAIFPLSGNAASAGIHAKAALETAVDIVNNAHPELGNLPLAKNAGRGRRAQRAALWVSARPYFLSAACALPKLNFALA